MSGNLVYSPGTPPGPDLDSGTKIQSTKLTTQIGNTRRSRSPDNTTREKRRSSRAEGNGEEGDFETLNDFVAGGRRGGRGRIGSSSGAGRYAAKLRASTVLVEDMDEKHDDAAK